MSSCSAAARIASPPPVQRQSASAIVAGMVQGSHVLQIEGYSRTKRLGNGNYIDSGTFDVGGHGWFIRYYPDGIGLDNAGWLSFYLLLRQRSDAGVAAEEEEVEASFKFSLLDEAGEPSSQYTSNESAHTFRTVGPDSDRAWGYQRFIQSKALEESAYLKNDSFSVRCDVFVSTKFRAEDRSSSQQRFVVDVPPSDLQRHLGRLLSSGRGADVVFEVAGGRETVAAHRCVLAARSSVFEAELFGPMKENAMARIRVDDAIDARVFRAMLHFIYTDSLPPELDGEERNADANMSAMAQHLLVVADRYDLQRLKLMCEDRLCASVDASTAATTLALAEQHGCRVLKEACLEFLKSRKNLEAVMASDGFDHLMTSCPSLIKELLAKGVACP